MVILLVVRLWMVEILLVAISLRVVIHTSPPSSSSSYSCYNTGQKDSKFPNPRWASLVPLLYPRVFGDPRDSQRARAHAQQCACVRMHSSWPPAAGQAGELACRRLQCFGVAAALGGSGASRVAPPAISSRFVTLLRICYQLVEPSSIFEKTLAIEDRRAWKEVENTSVRAQALAKKTQAFVQVYIATSAIVRYQWCVLAPRFDCRIQGWIVGRAFLQQERGRRRWRRRPL